MSSILLAKTPFLSPEKLSRATLEISAPERVDFSTPPVIMENSVTIPIPPTQAVDMRQNWRPRGRPSTLFRMDAPVVVNPDTLSNRALTSVNSCPKKKKGSIPKMQANVQAPTTMLFPSRKVSRCPFVFTKRMG